ncbi:hypothetical protein GGR56DRAFT_639696 [Xylariaceae sp. FL0804]|nr:hypothetical protein GGR56DRAFT_639696 [Xylariaceae sp. FL0804]
MRVVWAVFAYLIWPSQTGNARAENVRQAGRGFTDDPNPHNKMDGSCWLSVVGPCRPSTTTTSCPYLTYNSPFTCSTLPRVCSQQVCMG